MIVTHRAKSWLRTLGTVCFLLLALPLCNLAFIVVCFALSARSLPQYHAVDYDPALTQEACTAGVVIAALHRYRREHSQFPAEVTDLANYLPPDAFCAGRLYLNLPREWEYSQGPDANGFTLSRGLSREYALWYQFDGERGQWRCVECEGCADKTILLKT